MTNYNKFDGLDDERYFANPWVGLGYCKIRDTKFKSKLLPMTDSNKLAWIVYDGTIYNYNDMKVELSNLGCLFATNNDAEVILNAYLCYGESFVSRLRGMFAFAIWDKRKNRLVLGRDRFGIKPLYYSLNDEHIAFGSEMMTILAGGFSKKEIDWQAVDSYFSYGYILGPLTIYKDIRKLIPGSMLIVENADGTLNAQRVKYWQPEFYPTDEGNDAGYLEQIRSGLLDSVKAHMAGDLPIGAFLSAGIDSNAVVSAMAQLYPGRIKTFTIGFFECNYNEADEAKRCAAKYGTDHYELYLKPQTAEVLNKIIDTYEEPFADNSAIPTYFVSGLAAQYVKVVLSGDGGDEFFGGYDSYRRLLKINKSATWIRMGSPLFKVISSMMPLQTKGRRFLNMLAKGPDQTYANFLSFDEREKKVMFHADILPLIEKDSAVEIKLKYLRESRTDDFLSKMQELDIKTYMADDCLTKVARVGVAHALEVRMPLIDHEMFAIAARIPSALKIKSGVGKHIFRKAVKPGIPNEIFDRPKKGFTIPLQKWLKDDLYDYSRASLETAEKTGIFRPAYVKKLLEKNNRGGLATRIWPILVFSRWLKKIHTQPIS